MSNIIERARNTVAGFAGFHDLITQKLSIAGRSESAQQAYGRQLAKMALHFGKVPTEVSIEEVDSYLYFIQKKYPMPSETYFKHTVYGLRFAYRIFGLRDRYVCMPSIPKSGKLPTVLSKEEVKRLVDASHNIRYKVLILLLYGCGLRSFEARNLKRMDLDFDRKMIHVRGGKCRKDRYVPMSTLQIAPLKQLLKTTPRSTFLFHGFDHNFKANFEKGYSKRSIHWAVRRVATLAGIEKHVSPHTLRHTFATHLLEDGLDIVSIKTLLGHVKIETTLIYLHIARTNKGIGYSPLDTLFGLRETVFKPGLCPYYMNSVKADSTDSGQQLLPAEADVDKYLPKNQ